MNERDHGLTGLVTWAFLALAAVVAFYLGRDWLARRSAPSPVRTVSGGDEGEAEPPLPGSSATRETIGMMPPVLLKTTGGSLSQRPSKPPPPPPSSKKKR